MGFFDLFKKKIKDGEHKITSNDGSSSKELQEISSEKDYHIRLGMNTNKDRYIGSRKFTKKNDDGTVHSEVWKKEKFLRRWKEIQ